MSKRGLLWRAQQGADMEFDESCGGKVCNGMQRAGPQRLGSTTRTDVSVHLAE